MTEWDLATKDSTLSDLVNHLYNPAEAQDFENCNISTGINLVKRLRGLKIENNAYIPCNLHSMICNGVPYCSSGLYCKEPGEPFLEIRQSEAVFTGDGHIKRHVKPLPYDPPLPHDQKLEDGSYLIPIRRDDDAHIGSFECNGKWGFFRYCDGSVFLDPVFGYTDVFCEIERYCSRYARFNYGSGHVPLDADFDEDVYPNHKDIPDGRWGMIDAEHIDYFFLLVKPEYQYLSILLNKVIAAKKDGRWGMLNYYGDPITDFEWDDMWLDWEYGVIAKKETDAGPRYSILDSNGHVLINNLPGFPHLLCRTEEEEYEDWGLSPCYTARYFKHGDRYGVINCLGIISGSKEERIELVSDAVLTFEEAKLLIQKLD